MLTSLLPLLLCMLVLFNESMQKSSPSLSSYTAAVVEYATNHSKSLAERTTDYVNYIRHLDAADVDIIVFPESTLTAVRQPQSVPQANQTVPVVPCDNNEYDDNPIQSISCAARDKRTYVVINLTMKRNCTAEKQENHDVRPCADNNVNLYNTNVVFDRNGGVISIYRKVHLFGEHGINTTIVPDISWFDTDFGVRFGQFICFDILFSVPALNLIEMGITNIVYPTMWFSELPFLSAVQTQQSWAYTHNVNFLAAGANHPTVGSTGSGIYAGRQGAIKSIMLGSSESRMLVSVIAKNPEEANSIQPRVLDLKTPAIHMSRDQLDVYEYVSINSTDNAVQQYHVCHEISKMCCHFVVQLAPPDILLENTVTYSYVAAAYHGNRTFGGVSDGKVLSCSIFACTDNQNIKTCGTLYSSDVTVVNRYRFEQIQIIGVFPTSQVVLMPTTLEIGLLPLDSKNYEYVESAEYVMGKMHYKNVSMILSDFDHHLLTFGIYGRDFKSAAAQQSMTATVLVILFIVAVLHRL